MRRHWAWVLALGLLACQRESKPALPPPLSPELVERYLGYRAAINDGLELDLQVYQQGQLDGGWDALRNLLQERQTRELQRHQLSADEARQLQRMVQETVFVRQPFKDRSAEQSDPAVRERLELPQARARYGEAMVDALLAREELLYLEEQRSHSLLMSARP